MKNIFELGNQYAKRSSWKDFALLKLCLCAMGIVIGTNVPSKYQKNRNPYIRRSIHCNLYSSHGEGF